MVIPTCHLGGLNLYTVTELDINACLEQVGFFEGVSEREFARPDNKRD